MSDTPEELLELWSQRDREAENEPAVLIAYKSGDDPDEKPAPPVCRPVIAPVEPLLRESHSRSGEAVDSGVKMYPTYKIVPQPISLAKYHVRKSKSS